MYVPISYLVSGGLLLLILAWLALRRRGSRDLIAPPPGLGRTAPARPAMAASPATGDLDTAVRVLLANGNKIEAIKQVRGAFHLSLGEAKELVEAIERGEPVALPAAPAPAGPVDLEAELRALLATNRKIEAIKRAREALGLGLAEAKDHVEAIERAG